MTTRSRLITATLFSMLCMQPASAAVVAYTDFASWSAAVSGYGSTTTEGFNGPASNFAANSTGNVIGTQTTVDLDGGQGDAGPTGLTGTGFFQGEVDSSSKTNGDGLGLDFNFATGVGGFALNNFQNDNRNGRNLMLQEIGIVVDGQSFLVSDLLGRTNSSNGNFVGNTRSNGPFFLGFTSDTDLTGFSLIHGDFVAPGFVRGGNEEFYIGSMTLAGPAPSTVPIPGALPMLLAALAAFGGMAWRKQLTA